MFSEAVDLDWFWVETKFCPKCKEEQPLFEFHKSSQTKDGFYGWCKECQRKYISTWQEKNPMNAKARYLLAVCKDRAKRFNREFELDYDWLYSRLLKGCEVTGLPFNIDPKGRKGGEWDSPSIDRIDNTKGYTKDNCRVVLHRLNQLKSDGTDEDMIRKSIEAGDSFFA